MPRPIGGDDRMRARLFWIVLWSVVGIWASILWTAIKNLWVCLK